MKFIITESQYSKLIKEWSGYYYPGTKKPLGANGVDMDVFNAVLDVIPMIYSADTKATTLVNKIKSQNKVKDEDKFPIKQYLNQIKDYCSKNPNFEYKPTEVNFCFEIIEILSSDNDNIFSDSYGIATRLK